MLRKINRVYLLVGQQSNVVSQQLLVNREAGGLDGQLMECGHFLTVNLNLENLVDVCVVCS